MRYNYRIFSSLDVYFFFAYVSTAIFCKHICILQRMSVPLFIHVFFLLEDEANIMISIILSRIEDDLEAEARAHKS